MRVMKRLFLPMLAAMLAACNFQPSQYTANDIVLYGIKERHTIFYGKLDAGQTKNLTLGPLNITLSGEQPVGDLAVPGALSVNGKPTLLTNTANIREAFALATIPLSGDLSVLTRDPIQAVYHFDGQRWYDVGDNEKLEANTKVKLVKRERLGLRGVGLLTAAEADALTAYLQTKYRNQPLGLALIANGDHPDTPLGLNPRPDRNNITALYVQVGVPVDLLGGFANSEALKLTPLLSGSNSRYSSNAPAVQLDRSRESFANTWALMTGNQVPQPNQPDVDFARASVVTVFQGQKPTGGYGVAISGATLERGTLRVTLREPAPGVITTQALTSPFVSVIVTGGGRVERVVAVNASTGAPLR
jgi:PrcB C-terminal